jgi:hypothetical protein
MSKSYTYFMFPVDQVPANPGAPVWFASWSSTSPTVTWSTEQPPKPDAISTWAVAVVANASAPGASVLGDGGKDIPPPPEMPIIVASPSSPNAFADAFKFWLTARSP